MKLIVIWAFALACFVLTVIVGVWFFDTKNHNFIWLTGFMAGIGSWIGGKVYDYLTKKL